MERIRSSTWPGTKSAPDEAKTELEGLRGQLQQIPSTITTAVGGGEEPPAPDHDRSGPDPAASRRR